MLEYEAVESELVPRMVPRESMSPSTVAWRNPEGKTATGVFKLMMDTC